MAKTNSHDRNLRGVHELAEVIDGVLTMGRIARTIADENTIEVVSYLMNRVVVRKGRDTCTSTD